MYTQQQTNIASRFPLILAIRGTLLGLFCVVCLTLSARTNLPELEQQIVALRIKAISATEDNIKFDYNDQMITLLETALQEKDAYSYPFRSFDTNFIRLLEPDNHRFRLFNWDIIHADGTFEYFALLQTYNAKRKRYELYRLQDASAIIKQPDTYIGDPNSWYGALYYQLIYHKTEDRHEIYTLLGWDGNDNLTQKKIIEVLTFDRHGKPRFGATIFKKYPSAQNAIRVARVIFEYSRQSNMYLHYGKQLHEVDKVRDKKTKQWKTIMSDDPIIAFDRLIPMNNGLDDIAAFMVPETSFTDGFVFSGRFWQFKSNILTPVYEPKKTPYNKDREKWYEPIQ